MYNPYPGYGMLHGTYIRPSDVTNGHDAVVAAIKNLETGEHKLHIVRDPKFEYWITKPQFRHQNIRLERELISRLDTYVCQYRNLYPHIASVLGMKYYSPNQAKEIKDNPHLYGIDVGPLIRMKIEYSQKAEGVVPKLDIGMLDIETSVIDNGQEEILCASYTDWTERTTYEYINSPWCNATDEELQKRVEQEKANFVEGLNEKALAVWNEKPHQFKFIHCADERELIIKLIRCVVLHKPDLCGVWNISYDIPHIEKRAIFQGIPLDQLFCHPDVPKDLRTFKWKQDTKPAEHFTDLWHQVEAPGYTRWYDPMCLYSRLRKVQGRENFYTLEYIGKKIVGSGKIKFGTNNTHTEMQLHDQLGYCIYNCFDTILPCIIDAVTGDTGSMMVLVGISDISEYSKQTVMLKNTWFDYCRSKINSIAGSIVAPSSMGQNWDRFIGNVGGAVLSPNLLEVRGTKHLKETSQETSIEMLVNDIDATSLYPSIQMSTNLSRETRYASTLWIEGAPYTLIQLDDMYNAIRDESDPSRKKKLENQYKAAVLANSSYIEDFFGNYFTPLENAVQLCHDHFNLPNFEEMLKIFE